jgi:hypothetical protein
MNDHGKITMKANDYRGHSGHRQGHKFEEWPSYSFTTIQPLPFLHGRKWDDIALAYVHALRPSHLRVCQGSIQLDAQTWRVTVMLEEDGETIRRIDQEVCVGLPDGIEDGWELDQTLHTKPSPKA